MGFGCQDLGLRGLPVESPASPPPDPPIPSVERHTSRPSRYHATSPPHPGWSAALHLHPPPQESTRPPPATPTWYQFDSRVINSPRPGHLRVINLTAKTWALEAWALQVQGVPRLVRKRLRLGPYSSPLPRALLWFWGGGALL